MIVEQIYTGCLAQGAYYIESGKEAVVIDPLRETKPYIDRANKNNVKIKYILETHFHADFVSGHVDLSKATGAPIIFGPHADPSFDAHIAKDEEILKVGKLKIKVLHTPGHTMESTTYLLYDENDKEYAMFTGDTLFIGDVGRPDLAVKSDLTEKDLAGFLFESLRNKILPLPDDVIVYPAHGAGSACGKNMSKETFDTLGNQKRFNYALREDMTKEEFVKEVTDGLTPPPQYFPINVRMNKEGCNSIDDILRKGTAPLSVEAFEAAANETRALILDTRDPEVFTNGFIPNSINIGIDGAFAPWVGTLLTDVEQPILIVAEPNRVEEVVTRLARVGYDNTIGYLEGGFKSWERAGKEIEKIESISAAEFAARASAEKLKVVDVRAESEFKAEHMEGAESKPLNYFDKYIPDFDDQEVSYIHCLGGYRSMIAASILKAKGFQKLVNIKGGFKAMSETSISMTEYVCPTTLK